MEAPPPRALVSRGGSFHMGPQSDLKTTANSWAFKLTWRALWANRVALAYEAVTSRLECQDLQNLDVNFSEPSTPPPPPPRPPRYHVCADTEADIPR